MKKLFVPVVMLACIAIGFIGRKPTRPKTKPDIVDVTPEMLRYIIIQHNIQRGHGTTVPIKVVEVDTTKNQK